MVKHLQRELDRIKKAILGLGAEVEKRVQLTVQAVIDCDCEDAEWIIDSDYQIDAREVEVEEECLKILALHQPVAVDLRFIVAVIKINNDLERVADQAVNIAQRVLSIGGYEQRPPLPAFDMEIMAEKSMAMLKKSLDALVRLDSELAQWVRWLDDEVDAMKHQAADILLEAMKQAPQHAGYFLDYLLIARHLERIADHATNIAEEVVYLVEGEVVRHKANQKAPVKQ